MTVQDTSQVHSVMVSWLSLNHKAAPLLQALDGLYIKPHVEELYLCYRRTSSANQRELSALKETSKQLRKKLKPSCPKITEIAWESDAAPTSHDAIRPFAEKVLRRARSEHPGAKIVIHLSPGTPAMHAIWLLLGLTGFVDEPVELIQTSDKRDGVVRVHSSLDTWLRRYRKSKPSRVGIDDSGQLWEPAIVESPALREVFSKIEEWAPLRVPILLTGERGTGKTTLANLIRARSPFQKDGKGGWPSVVCGQFRVNPQLARSELFGHVRGAFTGATSDRRGLLEEADDDTLFLDEIADIDADTQRMLIAAVEGRGFSRLGESSVRQSQFRLLAATNRTLGELRGGLLDLDFMDRIAMFTLRVPPLRECREDLPLAWRRTLGHAAVLAGVSWVDLRAFEEADGVLEALGSHPLPGNFRDLQRAAFHLLAAANARKSEGDAVAAGVAALGSPEPVSSMLLPDEGRLVGALPLDLDEHLADYQRLWFRAAERRSGGVKTKAAELLGLKRGTHKDRRKKLLGEDPPVKVEMRRSGAKTGGKSK